MPPMKEVEQKSFVGVGGTIICVTKLLKKNEEPKYHDEPDVLVGLGLFPQPAHIVEQHLLVVPTRVDICNAAVLGERIDRSPILANGLGIKTTGFAVGKILFDRCRQRNPV